MIAITSVIVLLFNGHNLYIQKTFYKDAISVNTYEREKILDLLIVL
jgi:hypothetical protein